jgi:predicted metal-dependent peptidase
MFLFLNQKHSLEMGGTETPESIESLCAKFDWILVSNKYVNSFPGFDRPDSSQHVEYCSLNNLGDEILEKIEENEEISFKVEEKENILNNQRDLLQSRRFYNKPDPKIKNIWNEQLYELAHKMDANASHLALGSLPSNVQAPLIKCLGLVRVDKRVDILGSLCKYIHMIFIGSLLM